MGQISAKLNERGWFSYRLSIALTWARPTKIPRRFVWRCRNWSGWNSPAVSSARPCHQCDRSHRCCRWKWWCLNRENGEETQWLEFKSLAVRHVRQYHEEVDVIKKQTLRVSCRNFESCCGDLDVMNTNCFSCHGNLPTVEMILMRCSRAWSQLWVVRKLESYSGHEVAARRPHKTSRDMSVSQVSIACSKSTVEYAVSSFGLDTLLASWTSDFSQ